jgi:3-dehydroquinate dehydratase-1
MMLTLRIPEEGGRYSWEKGRRAELYPQLLPYVQAIDVELASMEELGSIIDLAHTMGKWVVCSAHALQSPASPDQIHSWQNQFCKRYLSPSIDQAILKIAGVLEDRADLRRLTRILVDHEWPVAVMGLGSMGALSRQIFSRLGSRLVYGYLDEPAANGQPSTEQIRAMLPDLFPG